MKLRDPITITFVICGVLSAGGLFLMGLRNVAARSDAAIEQCKDVLGRDFDGCVRKHKALGIGGRR